MQALETELAAHASDDRKIAALTREIADARIRLERAEAELRRMRPAATPATAPRSSSPSGPGVVKSSPTTQTTERSTSPVITLVVLFGGLGILYTVAAASRCQRDTKHAVEVLPTARPEAVAADRMLDDGVARAIELAPGAQLVAVEATGVRADGNLDPEYGELAVELVRDNGPEPTTRVDPNRPIGAPEPEHVYLRYDCIRFVYTHGRWQDQWPSIKMDVERLHSCFHDFDTHPPLHPHCSIAQIWDRIHDAPATTVAKLTLEATGWTFTIDDARFPVERHERDDCPR
ncbi:MAG TPA: hypothetical protein VGO00_00855 [Kofleriaceae bacterium]|nr:hypothetical protein [Kofleriaceae bacterium]